MKPEIRSFLAEYGPQYGLAAILGLLLLLNITGLWQTVLGLDTAIVVTVAAGYKTFYNSVSALLEKKISADVALCIAVIAALAAGQNAAAAEAMFIVMVGETLESFAAGRTEAAIRQFVARLPRVARLVKGSGEIEVDAASLAPDDLIVVRAGERIAADGIVQAGFSTVDESSITGELLPRDRQPGDEVYCGSTNGSGLLRIRVVRAGPETTLARVAALVEEAKGQQAPVERLADRYAKFFLPALLLSGALTWYFTRDWLRTVAVLIVACPCALILATPTAMVAAIGGLARRGILVRGGAVLQKAAAVDTVVFDKTGTVTEGRFEIVRVIAAEGTEDEVLALAATAETASDHALAATIVAEARHRGLRLPDVREARVVAGRGAQAVVAGQTIRAGNAAYVEESGAIGLGPLREEANRLGATAVFVAEDLRLCGVVLLRDRVRVGSSEAVVQLRTIGIARQMMLTGDRRAPTEAIARAIGIPEFEAELLPEAKMRRIRDLAAEGCTVAMIGDGINDAPALAAAAVGIAVAGASDLAAEAAGAVYLPHSLDGLPHLILTARRAMRTAWLNIVLFAGVLNLLAILACATGRLGPIGAAMTHQLSSFCVMMNSLRLLRVNGIGATVVERLRHLRARMPALAFSDVRRWVLDHRGKIARALPSSAVLLIALNGFYTVRPEEVGVVERFGRKLVPFREPGLHYKLPWPIERLTRIQTQRIRVVEIGFRTDAAASGVDPGAYEWNVQHRSGRFQSRPEESLMLTGDQNLIELNATVHYQVARPDAFLFRQLDGDSSVRAAAESVVQGIAATSLLDDILTTGRQTIEGRALAELQRRMDRYETGIRILRVKLQDVHPSQGVVDAFRDVSAAFEEKNRMIDQAEAYRNEQVALARGNAQARITAAKGYTAGRANRAEGDAGRFEQQERAYRSAPGPTETRLYLETMEQVLPEKRKFIVDSGKARRQLLLLEDGVEIVPPGAAILGGK